MCNLLERGKGGCDFSLIATVKLKAIDKSIFSQEQNKWKKSKKYIIRKAFWMLTSKYINILKANLFMYLH